MRLLLTALLAASISYGIPADPPEPLDKTSGVSGSTNKEVSGRPSEDTKDIYSEVSPEEGKQVVAAYDKVAKWTKNPEKDLEVGEQPE